MPRSSPTLPIVFIDTGMHFQQTLQYRDTLSAALGLTDVRTFHPVKDEVKAIDPKGVLNKTDPNACCEVRKVRPLGPALEGFEAWFTGRKRFHGGARAHLPVVEFFEGRYKINPLVELTQEDLPGAGGGTPPAAASDGGGRLSLDRLLAVHGASGGPE